MSRISLQWLLVIAAAFPCATAKAELITNGSFEMPAIPSGSFRIYSAGDASITGWTIVSGSVDLVSTALFRSFDGNQSLDLAGNGPGVIQQSFATIVGRTYALGFAYANNPPGNTSSSSAVVSVIGQGGATLLSQAISHGGSTSAQMNYQLFAATFTAISTTTTLRFTSTDPSSRSTGIVLDRVSVTVVATPEPSAWALLGSGLVGLTGLRWVGRRRGRGR